MCTAAIEKLGLCTFDRTLRLMSFGFRHGTPRWLDTDILIDASDRPTYRVKYPHDSREMQPRDVFHVVNRRMATINPFKSELRVNVGCEFGNRESVDMVRWLESRPWEGGWNIETFHRDV